MNVHIRKTEWIDGESCGIDSELCSGCDNRGRGGLKNSVRVPAAENFFHKDYEATLADTYGQDYEDSPVPEGGGVSE